MPYHTLNIPTGTPPELESIVRDRIDSLLRQVHAMLLLPVEGDHPGLDIVCKHAVALVLFGVVSGVSAKLYEPPHSMLAGARFKRVLTDYYPWDEEPQSSGTVCGEDAAKVIYDTFRNPLDHRLGIDDSNPKLLRGEVTDKKLEIFEKSETRPPKWNKPTLKKGAGDRHTLNIKIFYWGVRRMIWKVLDARVEALR